MTEPVKLSCHSLHLEPALRLSEPKHWLLRPKRCQLDVSRVLRKDETITVLLVDFLHYVLADIFLPSSLHINIYAENGTNRKWRTSVSLLQTGNGSLFFLVAKR
jgi:hypothetical protein